MKGRCDFCRAVSTHGVGRPSVTGRKAKYFLSARCERHEPDGLEAEARWLEAEARWLRKHDAKVRAAEGSGTMKSKSRNASA